MHRSPRSTNTWEEGGGGEADERRENARGVADPAEGPTFHAADKREAALSYAERISWGEETGGDKARMEEERGEVAAVRMQLITAAVFGCGKSLSVSEAHRWPGRS
jgi:hypothetical protein